MPRYTNPAVTMPYHQAPAGYRRAIYPPIFSAETSFAPVVDRGLPPLAQVPGPGVVGIIPALVQRGLRDQASLNNIDPRLLALNPLAAPVTYAPDATFARILALLSASRAHGQAFVAAGSSGAPAAAQVRQKRKYTSTSGDAEVTGPKIPMERNPRVCLIEPAEDFSGN